MQRVLVVDDEENLRLVLETLLGKHEYEPRCAKNAEEALGIVESWKPDFVLADVRMPGMSGIELCQALRARGHDMPVIVMSAYGSIELALGMIIAGSPGRVAEVLRRQATACGYDYPVLQFAFGDLGHPAEMASLELFAERVMPQFSP